MRNAKLFGLRLSVWCLLLIAGLFVIPGYVLAETVNISPFKIILNADGNSEDIQARIPMVIAAGNSITDFEASLRIDNANDTVVAIDFYYCAIDDILHIYFDRKEVLQYLKDNEIKGEVTAAVWGSFYDFDNLVEFSGYDDVVVIDPDEDNSGPHYQGEGPGN